MKRFSFVFSLVLCLTHGRDSFSSAYNKTCAVNENQHDANLVEMEYDIGYGKQTTLVYIEPDLNTMYSGNPPASTKVTPKFNGHSVKFINMSNKPVRLSWEPTVGGTPSPMNKIAAFEASGTASFPTHSFIMTDIGTNNVLKRFSVGEYPANIYYYDPYEVDGDPKATEQNLKVLNKKERELYQKWKDTLTFNEFYLKKTGRSYLANYLRDPPKHFMWPCDHFGQQHWVTTRETHFVELPPESKLAQLGKVEETRVLKEGDPRALMEYRDTTQPAMNMTLTALSVAPRVFEIKNFLSRVEVDHILQVAGGITLDRSTVGDVGSGKSQAESGTTDTRTSRNAWVQRKRSPIIDAVYRRAGDLMRMDEALLRHRTKDERPDWPTKGSLAEHLQ